MKRLDRTKIRIAMIKQGVNFRELAERYGASQQRLSVIANSQTVKDETAGKLAKALDCDVLDIIETEKK